MNATLVMLCDDCCGLNCKEHPRAVNERKYQCGICLSLQPNALFAESCCKHLLSTETLSSSHLAKEVKKRDVTLEYPEQALKGRRDK